MKRSMSRRSFVGTAAGLAARWSSRVGSSWRDATARGCHDIGHNCRRLSFEDILIRNAPCWTISVSTSRDVKVYGMTIANCTLVSRSAAVRLGYQQSRVRDVVINNLVISDTNRALGIFAGEGGWVENVVASNLTIHTRLIGGAWWGGGEPLTISAADSPTARIEGIAVRSVRARSENGIILVGCQGNVRDIDLADWNLAVAYGQNRPLMGHSVGLQPAPVRVAPDPEKHIPWLYADEVADVRLTQIRFGRQQGESKSFSMESILRQSTDVGQTDVRESSIVPPRATNEIRPASE